VGAIPEEVKAKQRAEKENSLREKIALEMKRYFGKDVKRIDHALMVAHHAEEIIKREGGDPLVILGSAFLHDIGLSKGQEDDHFQETEGPSITREILERLGIKKEPTEEICDIIGHHHHPREKETLNFQILYEADWLVNMKEKGLPREEVQAVIEKSFKTEAGRRLAEELFLS
jgi:HD superfamily phosphodiesterase